MALWWLFKDSYSSFSLFISVFQSESLKLGLSEKKVPQNPMVFYHVPWCSDLKGIFWGIHHGIPHFQTHPYYLQESIHRLLFAVQAFCTRKKQAHPPKVARCAAVFRRSAVMPYRGHWSKTQVTIASGTSWKIMKTHENSWNNEFPEKTSILQQPSELEAKLLPHHEPSLHLWTKARHEAKGQMPFWQ